MIRFTVYLVTQQAFISPVNGDIQEDNMAFFGHLHSEMNVLMDIAQMVREAFQPLQSMGSDEVVMQVTEPAEGLWVTV